MRVMLIEDGPDLAMLFKMWLESDGHDVSVRNKDFVSLLTPPPWEGIGAAVVDINLSEEVDGVAILTYLDATHPTIRRVACTASVVPGPDVEAMSDAVLLKPVNRASFLAAVRGA